MTASKDNTRKKPGRVRKHPVLKWLMVAVIAAVILLASSMSLAFWFYSRDLPKISQLNDYEPKTTTDVYDRNGRIFTRFFEERRTPKPLKEMPPILLKAVIAAEDSNFYKHHGTDWLGLVRAAWKNLTSGKVRQGASTITEQTVKTFLLSPERTLSRRFKAMLLAWSLEKNLSKDEILALYLNQIYMGHGNYGVAEAVRYYFGKDISKLTVEEAALIAGLPQGPEVLSPYKHPDRAKSRQIYVLGELLKNGFIEKAQYEAAKKAPLKLIFHHGEETTRDYYAEYIRQFLYEKLGQETVLAGGLRVDAALDRADQEAAMEALGNGLRDVDKRQGYRGPIARLAPPAAEVLARVAREKVAAARELSTKRAQLLGCADIYAGERLGFRLKNGTVLPGDPATLAEAVEATQLRNDESVVGIVSRVTAEGLQVFSGAGDSHIPFSSFQWARKYSPAKWTPAPKSPSDVFRLGDVILLRPVDRRVLTLAASGKTKKKAPKAPAIVQEFEVDQEPLVQGALIAMDTDNRQVLAMAGGVDFDKSQFNRAIQSRRQPGSAFKPVVYSAAISSRRYTPVTLVNDSPFVYKDPTSGNEWKPENFESDDYDGLLPLKEALAKSKNLISARLVQDLGVEAIAEQARRLGIKSDLPKYMSLALGAGEVTVLELANAYTTIAAAGVLADPVFVLSIKDSSGNIIWKAGEGREQGIDAAAAFVTADMMRGVVDHGTAVRAKAIGRPAAGKTGTTNESRDAWFGGFIPHMLAMVYVGFDDHTPLGTREQGGRTAVPIWVSFMQKAVSGRPVEQFSPPPGVVYMNIDTRTGLKAAPESTSTEFQAFV
ncbi:MAG: PBP1A family penicillin-binding protein, partial [Myxococcota bacterium]